MSFSACNHAQPLVKFPADLTMKDKLITPQHRLKDKVVVVMGATGTGKSRLSIELATRFGGEIINSDKIQVYKGLDIISNKVTDDERRGVPHYLLGMIDSDSDFTADDYVYHASLAAESITDKGHLPIIAGGSNSFIKALAKYDTDFGKKYEFCFLWVDASMPVLHSFLSKRVDRMVAGGLVAETRGFYEPGGDYSRGIRRAIGLAEMDEFFRNESVVDDETRAKLLEAAIDKIKANTCKLACRQVEKILRLREELGWRLIRLDATEAFLRRGIYAAEAWEALVMGPSTRILDRFLCEEDQSPKDMKSAIFAEAKAKS